MWPLLTPLWKTLTRGRSASDPRAMSFDDDWAGVLAELDLPSNTLRDVATTGTLEPHFRYRRFSKPKKDGTSREIAEPDPRLKRLQQKILYRHLAAEEPHPRALAYRSGKSTADHAWAHAGAATIVTADIKDFFPSTAVYRVEAWWRTKVDDDTARLFAVLTTDRSGLPQGAPTSPALSNLLNSEMDGQLARLASAAGARYTRYCDDLAFSWATDGPPSDLERRVRAALRGFGYALHPTKGWCVYHRRDEPEITGLILGQDGLVRLPDDMRRTMWDLESSREPAAAARLSGYRGYAAMIFRKPPRRRASRKVNRRLSSKPTDVPF